MKPYYADDWLTVYHGDARAVMAAMEPESVHCVVTSPPYWGLRDYGEPGQLGLPRPAHGPESRHPVGARRVKPIVLTVTALEAEPLRIGTIYTDTQDRAAFRLVAKDDRPDGRVDLWWEQVPHCPTGRHRDVLGLLA